MSYYQTLAEKFPVRKTAGQKAAFRAWAVQEAAKCGYKAQVESSGRLYKHNNVIIGNPDRAAIVYSAHYDIPARHLLPSLTIPRNIPVFYAWQLLIVLLLVAATLVITMLGGLVVKQPGAVLWIFVFSYLALLLLSSWGPANKNNANNNTSGLATVMETMAAIPAEQRNKVAFILFDDSEKGKQGAGCYAKEHVQVQCMKTVVNLDCVGVGQDFLVLSKKLARMRPEYARLCTALGRTEEGNPRQVFVLEKGLNAYTADYDCFQCGVAIMACKRTSGVGWYIPNLNTARDTQCDEGNIAFLVDRFVTLTQYL